MGMGVFREYKIIGMDEMRVLTGLLLIQKAPFMGAYGDFGGFMLRFPSFFAAFYQVFLGIYEEYG